MVYSEVYSEWKLKIIRAVNYVLFLRFEILIIYYKNIKTKHIRYYEFKYGQYTSVE